MTELWSEVGVSIANLFCIEGLITLEGGRAAASSPVWDPTLVRRSPADLPQFRFGVGVGDGASGWGKGHSKPLA